MASPFIGKTFTFTQPDGTKFKVRGWGDQHYAVFETQQGYSVVKNPRTGFFEIAQVSTDGTLLEPSSGPQGNLDGSITSVAPGVRIRSDAARTSGMAGAMRMGGRRCDLRRHRQKNIETAVRSLSAPVMAPPKRETVGDFVGLCLLIDFVDDPQTIRRDEVEKFCNEKGYSGFGNKGSVYDYFWDNSIGRCRYTNIVPDYYRASHLKSYYTDPAIDQGVRARQLIVEALTHLKRNHFNFEGLTADDEGFVYAMNIYYAGDVENNWAEGLWPHAWHLGSPMELIPGKFAFDYQFTDMSQELSLGTFCHENGHMLCDYPDLYDYGSESSGVGAYCLMCGGGNINEKNPTQISAYLKRVSGWANQVIQIQHNDEISLTSGQNDFAILTKDSGEYFIIENRIKQGRDISLPDEGLVIWHVDEEGNNSNEQMNRIKHYELSLEQADGEFRLERSPSHYGDNTDLFGETKKRFSDTTIPDSKWWNGASSNLDIYDISIPGKTVTFKTRLLRDEEAVSTIKGTSTPNQNIPDNRADGIIDTITINESATILGVQAHLDISHTYRGDLRVTLFTPWSEGIVLHERNQGGSADNLKRVFHESDAAGLSNLHNHNVRGEWRLMVQDLAAADIGILNSWSLEFITAKEKGPIVLEALPGTHIPDNNSNGIQEILKSIATGKVDRIEVSVNISHTWISDLKVSLHSPSGKKAVLHDLTGSDRVDLSRTYTPTTTPSLSDFKGEAIKGKWQLRVADIAGQDVGKLNGWRLVIHPMV